MSARRISVAMFVDACGWDVVGPRPAFLSEMFHRQSVRSLFGFSSACVPAILTGRLPNANDHWSSFFYSPQTCPFKALKALRFLPSSLVNRGRVRRYLSKAIAAAYGFTGYFQIYNLPFEALQFFDYGERHDIFRPGGINFGESIFDDLDRENVPHHVSNWRLDEQTNVTSLLKEIDHGEIRFAFLYTAKLDGLMHEHTKDSDRVDQKLEWYEKQVRLILDAAQKNYDEIHFALFSDHGMASVHTVLDLMPVIEELPLVYGRDYVAVYDSTMMRFWFFSEHAEAEMRAALPDDHNGAWVSKERLQDYGTYWSDGKYGHAVRAFEPGVLLNPSHMGNVAPRGMHGYRPDHEDSHAALVANFVPPSEVSQITDLYQTMFDMKSWAHQ